MEVLTSFWLCCVMLLYPSFSFVADWQYLMSVSPLAGIWIKPSRTSRMREKRADFVAGCLGGRVIAAGGLGQHILSFFHLFLLFCSMNWLQRCASLKEGRTERGNKITTTATFTDFCGMVMKKYLALPWRVMSLLQFTTFHLKPVPVHWALLMTETEPYV